MQLCGSEENPERTFRLCRTVWFNAWKYNDEDALLVALIRRILQEMAADDWFSKAAAKIFDPTYPRRDVVDTVLGWFSLKLKLGDAADAGLQLSTGTPRETPLAQKTAILDLFDDAFERLLAAWVHRDLKKERIEPENGVLVVFIDDLDRCLPEKMVQVLEAVKLFLDKEGCVFYLGADAEVLQQAVAKQYAQAGVDAQEARDYLEKIIQLRFRLPPATHESMQSLIHAYPAAEKALGDAWQLLVTGAALNPRKVKTFVNDLNLAWAMLQNSGQEAGFTRRDFNTWQVLLRVAPQSFALRVRERLDDPGLRFKFVQEAMRWAREAWEDEEDRERLHRQFGEYEDWRFKRVLRDAAFTEAFTPVMLDALVHLTALPQPAAEKTAAESGERKQVRITGGARRGAGEVMTGRETARGLTFAEMPFVRIPAGLFLMGSTEDNKLADSDERPQHTLNLDYDYYLGRFPVTNADFARFVEAAAYRTQAEREGGGWVYDPEKDKWNKTQGADWRHPRGPESGIEGREDHPVVQVSWHDARAYIQWLNKTFATALPKGYRFALPSEAEWEKAARGEFGNEWPWGNEWREGLCNAHSKKAGDGDTTPVGQFSLQGDSPYGCADMAGNVWEWTRSLWGKDPFEADFKYPYQPDDGRENLKAGDDVLRIVRGGSWFSSQILVRAAFRNGLDPDSGDDNRGFRVGVFPVSLF